MIAIPTFRAALLDQRITYLLLARFSSDIAAPLPSSLSVNVGGPLTVVDASNVMSQSGGTLRIAGTLAAANGVFGPSFARTAGRAFIVDSVDRTSPNNIRVGWDTVVTQNAPWGIRWNANTIDVWVGSAGGGVMAGMYTAASSSSRVSTFVIQRGTGALLIAQEGSTNTLLWVWPDGATALVPRIVSTGAAHTAQFDNFRVLDLPAPWNTDEGIATARIASNSAGNTISHTADAWIEQTLTAATGVDKDLYVRWTDDNNCWIVRQNQGGSTVKLIEKVAGVETSRGSVATTYNNGTAYRHIAICEGSVIKVYVDTTLKITYSSASFQATATTAKAQSAGTELKSYPRTPSLPNV